MILVFLLAFILGCVSEVVRGEKYIYLLARKEQELSSCLELGIACLEGRRMREIIYCIHKYKYGTRPKNGEGRSTLS